MLPFFLLLSAVAALAHFEMLDGKRVRLHLDDNHKFHNWDTRYGHVLKSDAATQTYDVQVKGWANFITLSGLKRIDFELKPYKSKEWDDAFYTSLFGPVYGLYALHKKQAERTT